MNTLRLGFFILIVSLVFSLFFLIQGQTLNLPWQSRTDKKVYSTLMETSEASLLQSAEFRMKVLFPYDFMEEGDDVNWQVLQWFYNNDPDAYLLKSSLSFYPDLKLPAKWKYASLYALCRESGVDPANDSDFFIVISAIARAGVPFSSDKMLIQPLPLSADGSPRVDMILPSPGITEIIIEDRTDEDNGFPELTMTPDQWSRFIRILSPQIRELAVREGILDLAEESAALLLKDLFEGAGIEIQKIEFSS
ncbi:DUF4230 domain-containing protein [Oceanispirochaeta sp.]|jgi:hypothetical protein|uniref:DUF4230 domain-containing protein n=1 Tax=Oceanispirochaeta sp. TaxID=2035350 RepID=UPI00263697BF|nr:DUF4230 domain-containing protein [Oceanispirochaeta sp.]MDA3957388.1 DUF4230 domain-containing protein [Oceanispirochaeta sp.]